MSSTAFQELRQQIDDSSRIVAGEEEEAGEEEDQPQRNRLDREQQQSLLSIPPMETVLYNLHCKCCNFALRKTNRWWRCRLEEVVLILAVCGFVALWLAHTTFLQSIPPTCLSSIPGISFDDNVEATHLTLLPKEDQRNSFAIIITRTLLEEQTILWPICDRPGDSEHDDIASSCVGAVDSTTRTISDGKKNVDIYFTYSKHQGWFLRHPTRVWELQQDNASASSSSSAIAQQYIYISKSDTKCFGEPFLQRLVFHILTPDTVMVNWLIGAYGQQGYVYNPRSGKELNLNQHRPYSHQHDRSTMVGNNKDVSCWSYLIIIWDWISHKTSIVAKTTFLFFVTTTLVSFTLRETQGRMLHFTHHLLLHVRSNRPVVNLVVKHVAENVVFVPIMVGIIFFLIEFYRDDKLLAFMVLTLLWICESFSVVSLRTVYGIQYFPRTFFLLFAAFHFYYFSFPFGFSYAALTTSILFMVHSMLFFWHRYELPAVCRGQVRRSSQPDRRTINTNLLTSNGRMRSSSDEDDVSSSSSSSHGSFGLGGEIAIRPSESYLNIQESALQAIVGTNDFRQPALQET